MRLKYFFFLSFLCATSAMADSLKGVPSKQYIVIDYNTGSVLASQEPDKRVAPASITKLMTVYVALSQVYGGKFTLNDKVRAGPNTKVKGSRMWLAEGDVEPLELMLKGIMIVSGNDASVAVAEHISGSEKTFVALMNSTGKAMGLTNSHFTNVHGLDHPEHYMSARDVSILARKFILYFPKEYKWFKTPELTYKSDWGKPITQSNTNNTLTRDPKVRPYVDGMKTGRTKNAGFCLVASARANNNRLISVVLGSKNAKSRSKATNKLLKYGFDNFVTERVLSKEAPVSKKIAVWKGVEREVEVGTNKDIILTLPRGKKTKVVPRFRLHKNIVAPAKKGTDAGYIEILVNGEVKAQAPLVTLEDVEAGSFVNRTTDHFRLMHK